MFYYNQSLKKQNVICCALNVVFCFIPPDTPLDGHDCQSIRWLRPVNVVLGGSVNRNIPLTFLQESLYFH